METTDEILTTGVWRAAHSPTHSSGAATAFANIIPQGESAIGWYFLDGTRHVEPAMRLASGDDIIEWVLGPGTSRRTDGRLLAAIGNGYVRADVSGTLHDPACCHVAAHPTPATADGMLGCTQICQPFEPVSIVFARNEHLAHDVINAILRLANL